MIDRTVDILSGLIAHPTVSSESNLELVTFAADLLGSAGFRTSLTSDPTRTKANLFASVGPDVDGGVVLSGHTDVVPVEGQDWSRDPFRAWMDEGRVYGRGSSDMKGFIACALAAAPGFASADLDRPIHIALTYDEEVGCHGARVMLDHLSETGPRPGLALLGEPTDMRVVGAHKGCYEFTTEIRGVERHASLAAGGAGAIHAAARFVSLLDRLAEELAGRAPGDGAFDPPGSTINVGRIDGGVARNITAGTAVFEWEIRPVTPEDGAWVLDRVEEFVSTELLPAMRSVFPDATVVTETIGKVGGLTPDPDNPAVALAQRLVGDGEVSTVSFGTEAGVYQEHSIPAAVCGPGTIGQAHKPDEYVEISQLESCLAMLDHLRADLTRD